MIGALQASVLRLTTREPTSVEWDGRCVYNNGQLDLRIPFFMDRLKSRGFVCSEYGLCPGRTADIWPRLV